MADRAARFEAALSSRILVLDGGMGTMLMMHGLWEEDFRGEEFAGHSQALRGNLDLLTLTRPDLVEAVHRAYLNAGADIISTNTFNANAIIQQRYGTEHLVARMNREAAALARRTAADLAEHDPDREIFVAGSIGPTDAVPDDSPKELLPPFRREPLPRIREAFREQAKALLEGGVDVLLAEAVTCAANAAAVCEGIAAAFKESGERAALWLSGTPDQTGERLLSGERFEELVAVAERFDAAVIGINCGYGIRTASTAVRILHGLTDRPLGMHPSAGIPDEAAAYPEGAEAAAAVARELISEGIVRIVGGCCGTTPEYIRALAQVVRDHPPDEPPGE